MRSMTGFGSGSAEGPSGTVSVELRSVNHRSLKVALRAMRASISRSNRSSSITAMRPR